jgi:hypothetical protein
MLPAQHSFEKRAEAEFVVHKLQMHHGIDPMILKRKMGALVDPF